MIKSGDETPTADDPEYEKYKDALEQEYKEFQEFKQFQKMKQ